MTASLYPLEGGILTIALGYKTAMCGIYLQGYAQIYMLYHAPLKITRILLTYALEIPLTIALFVPGVCKNGVAFDGESM